MLLVTEVRRKQLKLAAYYLESLDEMEGAQLPWKVQKIDISRGPPADYSSLSLPLPKPPNGMKWVQEKETKVWRLISAEEDQKSKELGLSESSVAKCASEEAEKHNFLEHLVLPTDTLAGICIRYKVTATQLRQANCFSGSNLSLAPPKLIVPINGFTSALKQDASSPEYKLHALIVAVPQLSRTEAKAYLQMAEWDVEDAIKGAKEDLDWETSLEESNAVLVVHEAVPLLLDEANSSASSVDHKKERELEMAPLLTSIETRYM